jgi:hypothetical protein
VGRLDVPLDASPKYRALCERIKDAIAKHGSLNSYYLHNARCIYHLTNHHEVGVVQFRFEGTVLTDQEDLHCQQCDLRVELAGERCEWLTAPIVQWFSETVPRSVAVEFDRYIKAGDLEKSKQRVEKIRAASEDAGGFIGMYL